MRKAVSLVMAGVMAASTCITVSAAETDKALTDALALVKQRITVEEDISEFTYSTSKEGPVNVYSFNWHTPKGADVYKSVSVKEYSGVITSYYNNDGEIRWLDKPSLANMSSAELYSAAVKHIKQLNPTVYGFMKVDKESLSMYTGSITATFTVQRVKNGVPVKGDYGRIVLNKNTGELLSFNISWHPKAAFQSKKDVISEDAAWEKYGDLISLQPRYEIEYDWENDEYVSRLVYFQSDSGELNAFTGERSDFVSDAFSGGETEEVWEEDCADEENPATGAGDKGFTPEELEELNKELPYGNEGAVIKLMKSNRYLTYEDGMVLTWDNLFKETRGGEEKYVYTASFTASEKEDYFSEEPVPVDYEVWDDSVYNPSFVSIDIMVNAETGEVLSYSYYNSDAQEVDTYDMQKADKLAEKVMKSLAPTHVKDYTDYSGAPASYETTYIENGKKVTKTKYWGSGHTYARMVNGITVSGNSVDISFDSKMRLNSYSVSYVDVEFADTKDMLTPEQALEKFRETHDLELYYKAKTGKKKTATVLVYGCDTMVYCDAFTGEQVYDWSYERGTNDLSGITSPDILRMAEVLDDNGLLISAERFSENDAVKQKDFASLSECFSDYGIYRAELALPSGNSYDRDDKTMTRGDALTLLAVAKCGKNITQIKGIFKNPFTDVSDNDDYLGCYAVAYALGMAKGGELKPAEAYTYGELITLVYEAMT